MEPVIRSMPDLNEKGAMPCFCSLRSQLYQPSYALKGKRLMDQHVSSHLAQMLTHTFRVTLLALLLGALVAFLVGSFVPPAHAQTAASSVTPATTVTVQIRTMHANSVRVMELPGPIVPRCYNTPTHQVTITLQGGARYKFVGYSRSNCSGAILCETVVNI